MNASHFLLVGYTGIIPGRTTGILMWFDDDAGTGLILWRQGIDIAHMAVFLTQRFQRAEFQCTHGARGRTGRGSALHHVIQTEIAFGHFTGFRIVLRRTVGAGPFTIAAADAFGGIDVHDAVFPFVHGLGGTCGRACRILAVIAGDGQVEAPCAFREYDFRYSSLSGATH